MEPNHEHDSWWARIDERTKHLEKVIEDLPDILKEYVTKVEFQLIKMFVVGLITMVLMSVGAAIISWVIIGRHP
jgi:uncharacterized Rmd1/YagE family protein